MSEFFIFASTAQAAIIVVQEIIFSEFEEREEGQNYNNAFVTTMRKIQFITKANQFSRNKVDDRIMAIGHT